MKCASVCLALCGLTAMPGCVTVGGSDRSLKYLNDVRIADVIPGQSDSGILLWTAKVVAETKSGEKRSVYVLWIGGDQIKAFPTVGEVCTIAYRWDNEWAGALATTNVVGKWQSIERGQWLMAGDSATCGARVYVFDAAPKVDRSTGAEQ